MSIAGSLVSSATETDILEGYEPSPEDCKYLKKFSSATIAEAKTEYLNNIPKRSEFTTH